VVSARSVLAGPAAVVMSRVSRMAQREDYCAVDMEHIGYDSAIDRMLEPFSALPAPFPEDHRVVF
jgi:hypothetical protein